MSRVHNLKPALALVFLLMSGCAWNYAGQEGKDRRAPVESPDVKVVQLEKTETSEVMAEPEVEEAPVSTSPCGVDAFVTHYFDASTQVERRVDCESRKITDMQRKPLGETLYVDRKDAGYPEATWYIRVDPKGIKEDVLTNESLLKLSQVYRIEFFGRASDGLLVYVFLDELS